MTSGGTTAVHRRRRDRAERLDARRLLLGRRVASTTAYDNYYIASNRAYVVVRQVPADRAVQLRVRRTKPDFVEHFPYQNGLLVSLLGHLAVATTTRASTPARA